MGGKLWLMPMQPSPIAETRRPCPSVRVFIVSPSVCFGSGLRIVTRGRQRTVVALRPGRQILAQCLADHRRDRDPVAGHATDQRASELRFELERLERREIGRTTE